MPRYRYGVQLIYSCLLFFPLLASHGPSAVKLIKFPFCSQWRSFRLPLPVLFVFPCCLGCSPRRLRKKKSLSRVFPRIILFSAWPFPLFTLCNHSSGVVFLRSITLFDSLWNLLPHCRFRLFQPSSARRIRLLCLRFASYTCDYPVLSIPPRESSRCAVRLVVRSRCLIYAGISGSSFMVWLV